MSAKTYCDEVDQCQEYVELKFDIRRIIRSVAAKSRSVYECRCLTFSSFDRRTVILDCCIEPAHPGCSERELKELALHCTGGSKI